MKQLGKPRRAAQYKYQIVVAEGIGQTSRGRSCRGQALLVAKPLPNVYSPAFGSADRRRKSRASNALQLDRHWASCLARAHWLICLLATSSFDKGTLSMGTEIKRRSVSTIRRSWDRKSGNAQA